jgi:hypothetical protein
MVSILAAGFVILSTFVPTANACSVSLVLVHLSLFMFVTSGKQLKTVFVNEIIIELYYLLFRMSLSMAVITSLKRVSVKLRS